MSNQAVLLGTSARHIHTRDPIITFPTTGGGSWKVWYRFLALRNEPVFEIGNICGTCEFWFRRQKSEAESIEIDRLQQVLGEGLSRATGDVIDTFGQLLQSGAYRIGLSRLVPTFVQRGSDLDYFVHEQQEAWPDRVAEGPNDPATSYYRVMERSAVVMNTEGDLGYEFIAPLQDPRTLDDARVTHFEEEMARGKTPTAIAVAVLDIKQYYDSEIAHWCLTHYLLDGHHKVAAAARSKLPITLLTFIATEHGISSPEQVDQLLADYPTAIAA